MKKLLTLLALSIQTALLAQTPTNVAVVQNQINSVRAINYKSFDFPTFNLKDNEIRGSRYLNDEYTEGALWLTKNRQYREGYFFKFDEVENSVQVKHKDGRELLLDKEEVVICQLFINGKTVSYIPINMPNELNKIGIFQVLFIGETYQLLKLPNKRLRKNVKSMGVGGGFDYDQYVSEHRYFVKKKEGEMIEFKPNKKDIIKAFDEKKAALENVFKDSAYKKGLSDAQLAQIVKMIDE